MSEDTYETQLDLGPLPMPNDQDAMWAWKLWNALQIPIEKDGAFSAFDREGGTWDMPGVGRFQRTGSEELTLTEIHADMAQDSMGVTVWHKRDWIVVLGQLIGWRVVIDRVQKADEEPITPAPEAPLEHIGKTHVCPCGMIYTLLPAQSSELRVKLNDDGDCLNPHCDIVVPLPWASYMCVVNDTAVIAKQEAQAQMELSHDEEEGDAQMPLPIPINSEGVPVVSLPNEEE